MRQLQEWLKPDNKKEVTDEDGAMASLILRRMYEMMETDENEEPHTSEKKNTINTLRDIDGNMLWKYIAWAIEETRENSEIIAQLGYNAYNENTLETCKDGKHYHTEDEDYPKCYLTK